MIIRRLKDIIDTERDVHAENGNWASRRFLLKDDGVGFSFTETTIYAGTETYIWYKNHVEAVYCVGGRGEIEDLTNGQTHSIEDGMMYCLNGHEKHYLRASEDLRLICVFTPPLTGREVHDEEGTYPADPDA